MTAVMTDGCSARYASEQIALERQQLAVRPLTWRFGTGPVHATPFTFDWTCADSANRPASQEATSTIPDPPASVKTRARAGGKAAATAVSVLTSGSAEECVPATHEVAELPETDLDASETASSFGNNMVRRLGIERSQQ